MGVIDREPRPGGPGLSEPPPAAQGLRGRGGGFSSALNGLIGRARRAAQRRGQNMTTAHVLLVMAQADDATGHALAARGAREGDLLSALRVIADEPASASDVAVERAHKLAGGREPQAAHLLLALLREPRSVAHRCLVETGVGVSGLAEDLGALVGAASRPPERSSASGRTAARARRRLEAASPRELDPGRSDMNGRPPRRASSAARSGALEPCAKLLSSSRAARPPTPPRPRAAKAIDRTDPVDPIGGDPTFGNPEPETFPTTEPTAQRAEPGHDLDGASVGDPHLALAQAIGVDRATGADGTSSLRSDRSLAIVSGPAGIRTDPSAAPLRSVGPIRQPLSDHGQGVAVFPADDRDLEALCPTLFALGRDLTAIARHGAADPVIGRDAEIEHVFDVLARRRGNNPLLVGPSGVGKTAIVEGLAQRLIGGGPGTRRVQLAAGRAPMRFIVELSAGALMSGTGVRGALAERLQKIRSEVAAANGQVLLFIDEIHAVVSGQDSPDDLVHELKTALARGELPCIGATTEEEFRSSFERDPALLRRFSRIDVGEPTTDVAYAILASVAPRYAEHHGLSYDDEALRAAVTLAQRYLPERRLPDKAISVIDLAAARERRRGRSNVDVQAVAAVIANEAKIPVERILSTDSERFLTLEDRLAERLVGHHEVIERIGQSLRRSAAGLRRGGPLGTFLLMGPTGVGKTEMAKAVSELVFPDGGMTRIDMSELSEAHAVARLLGAPPGYVGHDESGQLTEPVRRRPYQLILLDEIEKAHIDVLLVLLPLLDEGRLTDAKGRTVDFRNTIVFMTSNLGADLGTRDPKIGFGGATAGAVIGDRERRSEGAIATVRRTLPPELFNRIDELLYFHALDETEVAVVAARMLEKIGEELLREKGIALAVQASAIDSLIRAGGFDPTLGARPMRRTIARLVEVPLSDAILRGGFVRGDIVTVVGDDRRIELMTDARASA